MYCKLPNIPSTKPNPNPNPNLHIIAARSIELCLHRHLSAELGLYFTVFLFTMICDVWVAACQQFVKQIYDAE